MKQDLRWFLPTPVGISKLLSLALPGPVSALDQVKGSAVPIRPLSLRHPTGDRPRGPLQTAYEAPLVAQFQLLAGAIFSRPS